MRHGVLNGGKRLRPFLVLESAALFGADETAALRVAAALECVHCYSLIHDDLPAMDDDDLRRGQPTVHRAFDEATAILAGDSLLTLAFDIIADEATALAARPARGAGAGLARAAGIGGMAGGQALDLEAERTRPDEAGIITLQAMKTGALIRFACEAGAIVAGATAGRSRAAGRIRLGDRARLPARRRQTPKERETIMGKLDGKVACITGGTRGVGSGDGRCVHREGARSSSTDATKRRGRPASSRWGRADDAAFFAATFPSRMRSRA